MATASLELSPEVLATLRRSPDEFVREMRIAAAVFWYLRGEVSRGAAAEIAGMNEVEFNEVFARQKSDSCLSIP